MKYFLKELRELSIKELRELYFKYEREYEFTKHPENSDQQLINSKCLKGMANCKKVIDEKQKNKGDLKWKKLLLMRLKILD